MIDNSPIITIPRITDAPSIINARNLTAKQNLKATPCVHLQVMCNNTSGVMNAPIAPATYSLILSGAGQQFVSQQAINDVRSTTCLTTHSHQLCCSLPS
jgi:hypothetical protein